MSTERPPSPLGLAVLCLLYGGPLHPYRMQRLLKEWGKDQVINVGQRSSLYKTIGRLSESGLIAVRQTERDHQYPERTVYEITESGRAADEVFHATLLSASANIFLVTISTGITAAITWSTLFKARTHRLDRDALPDHVKVFEAIAAGDVEAARATMLSLINLAYSDCTLPRAQKGAPIRRARR